MHRRLSRALRAFVLACLSLLLSANSAAKNLVIGPLVNPFLQVDAYATEASTSG